MLCDAAQLPPARLRLPVSASTARPGRPGRGTPELVGGLEGHAVCFSLLVAGRVCHLHADWWNNLEFYFATGFAMQPRASRTRVQLPVGLPWERSSSRLVPLLQNPPDPGPRRVCLGGPFTPVTVLLGIKFESRPSTRGGRRPAIVVSCGCSEGESAVFTTLCGMNSHLGIPRSKRERGEPCPRGPTPRHLVSAPGRPTASCYFCPS